MAGSQQQKTTYSEETPGASSALELLRVALKGTTEGDRYRMLAAVLGEFANKSQASGKRRRGDAIDESDAVTRKLGLLAEEKASLVDECASLRADLEHLTMQLESEKSRSQRLELLSGEQRARLDSLRKESSDLAGQLQAKNGELHDAHMEQEQLQLQVQRAKLEGDDTVKLGRLEAAHGELAKEVVAVRAEMERVRIDKDGEIAVLNNKLAEATAKEAETQEVPFGELWDRLAAAAPQLVDGATSPTRQSGQRAIDTLAELVGFVDDFDKLIRPFLTKYTRHHTPLRVPWEAYAKGADARTIVRQTLAPMDGKPVGVVKIRLRGLYVWSEAALIACDAAVESIASELHAFLMGSNGAGADPNRKIKEFLRSDGHELFLQHVRQLRGLKLAEAFGRGR